MKTSRALLIGLLFLSLFNAVYADANFGKPASKIAYHSNTHHLESNALLRGKMVASAPTITADVDSIWIKQGAATNMTFFAFPNTGNPNSYTITAGARVMPGFTSFTAPLTPLAGGYSGTIDLPEGTAPGIYDFNIVLKNSTSGEFSPAYKFTSYISGLENVTPPTGMSAFQGYLSAPVPFTFTAKGLHGSLLQVNTYADGESLSRFQISKDTISEGGANLQLPIVNGQVGPVTLYVRLSRLGQTGSYTGTISFKSVDLPSSFAQIPIPTSVIRPLLAPTVASSNLRFTRLTNSSVRNVGTLVWTKGNANAHAVYIAQASVTSLPPMIDGISPGGSDGWRLQYVGQDSTCSVDFREVTGDYRVFVIDYNGPVINGQVQATKYLKTGLNPISVTVGYKTPTQAASNITLNNITSDSFTVNWTKGNGQARAVFVYNDLFDTNMHARAVVDGQRYTADTRYAAVQSNCVFNGTGSSVTVTGLYSGFPYKVFIYEYNDGSDGPLYLKSPEVQVIVPGTSSESRLLSLKHNYPFTFTQNISQYNTSGLPEQFIFTPTATNVNAKLEVNLEHPATSSNSGYYEIPNNVESTLNLQPGVSNIRIRVTSADRSFTNEAFLLRLVRFPPPPTVQASNVVIANIKSFSATLSWTNGNGAKRLVLMRERSATPPSLPKGVDLTGNSVFKSGGQYQVSGWYCVYNGTGSTVNVTGLFADTNYWVYVVEANGAGEYINYTNGSSTGNPVEFITEEPRISITSSLTQFTGTQLVPIAPQSFKLKLTSTPPATITVSASQFQLSEFSDGEFTSSYQYVALNNSDKTIYVRPSPYVVGNITGQISVSSPGLATLSIPVSANIQPPAPATVSTQASYHLTFSNTTANSTTVSWSNGNGARRAVFVKLTSNGVATAKDSVAYTAGNFAAGTQIGTTGWYCVYNGSGNSTTINGLNPQATYRVTVVDYNGPAGSERYIKTGLAPNSITTLADPSAAPTASAYNVKFTNTTANSTSVSWTNGNGTARAVFIANTNYGFAAPATNTTYTPNTTFAAGTQVGTSGWYCIYNGTGSSVNVTGLTGNQTYRVTVVEYNGNAGAQKYISTGLAPASIVTPADPAAAPTQASYRLTFTNVTNTTATVSWTNGNGTNRAVFVAQTNFGVAAPANNTTYTPNTAFTSGTQIASTGWYCVYTGNGSSVNLTGLTSGVTYRVTVVDYNGTAGSQKYLATGLAPANVATVGIVAPSQASYRLAFTNTTATSTTLSWTNGTGAARAVFVKQTNNGYAQAVNNTTYSANSSFGAGTQIGTTGWYCVYVGTGNSTTISGLNATTLYRFTVVDYNGSAGSQQYIATGLAPAMVFTGSNGGGGSFRTSGIATASNLGDSTSPAIEAANILSPNGDGKNDTWIVKNIEAYPNSTVAVYTKDGRQIFQEKGYYNEWNGGGSLTKGTYYYTIDLGNGEVQKGYITVL